MFFYYVGHKEFPFIIKSYAWVLNKIMVIEILLNNEIQTFFYSNEVTFSKGEKYKCIHHWKKINS